MVSDFSCYECSRGGAPSSVKNMASTVGAHVICAGAGAAGAAPRWRTGIPRSLPNLGQRLHDAMSRLRHCDQVRVCVKGALY